MRKFKVVVEGRNFLIAGTQGVAKHGFYTIRFIEATDRDMAVTAAVEQLRARQTLREMTLNDPGDPPMMYAVEIEEVASFDGADSRDHGLVWYPEDRG